MTTQAPPGAIPLSLLPKQWEFVTSEVPYTAMFGGRRAGKTRASVMKAFAYVTAHPGAIGLLSEPQYPNVRDVLIPTIRQVFGKAEGTMWKLRGQPPDIEFLGPLQGSKILLRAAAVEDKLRGLELAFFGMDEAAQGYQGHVWKILLPCLTQPGYPPMAWVTTTPRGHDWLWEMWAENAGADHQYWKVSIRENKHLSQMTVDSLYREYGDTPFAIQELEGEFVAHSGLAFPMFKDSVHVRQPTDDLRNQVVGMDFGSVSPTSMHEVGEDKGGRLWVVREFYKPRCPEAELVRKIGDWRPRRMVVDPTAKDVIDRLRNIYQMKFVYKARSNDFDLRYRLMLARLSLGPDGQPGIYISPACPNLISELHQLAFHQPKGEEHFATDRWVPGLPDHGYDSCVYAIQEFDRRLAMLPKRSIRVEW